MAAATARTVRPLSVLVVEDDPLLRLAAVSALEDAGLEVLEAACADDALALLLDRDGVDVLFTDVDMPGGMDGMQLATMVGFRWPSTRLLVTSGGLPPAERGYGRLGDFLPKPYRDETVVARVLG